MEIKIDVDGVLRDFIWQLQQTYLKDFPNHPIKWVDEWNLHKFFVIGKAIYHYAFEYRAEEIFTQAPPYRGQIEALNRFVDRHGDRMSITIASTQPKHNEEYTRIWLNKHRVPYDTIVFSDTKSEIPGNIILDDAPHNLDEVFGAGQIAICQSRPWNRFVKYPRVRNMKEFLTICEVMERWNLI